MTRTLLIGVDVGGTNTDSVLLNPEDFDKENRGVLAWYKSPTTSDVSVGIENAIDTLFSNCSASKFEVASVTIGTTHFINAVVEQDRARLDKVAVLRLIGPYAAHAPPFGGWPEGLAKITRGYVKSLDGGVYVDGREVKPLNVAQIKEAISEVKALGIKAVAIVGLFSPMSHTHEDTVAEMVKKEIAGVNVVVSHSVSGISFIERENATILNASIMGFAKKIITSFRAAVRRLGMNCPVMLTQNDGTISPASEAMQIPVRSFSSGATNSMRGASFLCSKEAETVGKSVLVVDIGGTTTDVGLLLPSGFPRQSASYSDVGGVRTNFSMPHVESIGLGGGSIVRINGTDVTIGPDSVGAEITKKALIYGGSVATTSDMTVAMLQDQGSDLQLLGTPKLVKGKFNGDIQKAYSAEVKVLLETVLDRMKTSPEPLPVLLVGGGSIIAPDHLEGASVVLRPPYFGVANAIGAAIGKLSSSLQTIKKVSPGSDNKDEILTELKAKAVDDVVAKGARRETVVMADYSASPIPYVLNTIMFTVKVVGEVDYETLTYADSQGDGLADCTVGGGEIVKDSSFKDDATVAKTIDIKTYRPTVNSKNQWILSLTDLEFIRTGVYILGCGGGGTPYPQYLELKAMLEKGDVIRLVDPKNVQEYSDKNHDTKDVVIVGFLGSPTVAEEQIHGSDLMDAYKLLVSETKQEANLVIDFEIGGANGMRGLFFGSSSQLNVPVVDGDLMGRAYPYVYQILPTVYSDSAVYAPSAMSDGNGNNLVMKDAISDFMVESVYRASLAEMGAHCGTAAYLSSNQVVNHSVHNSFSLAWRIGRAVHIARISSEIDHLPQKIIDAVGGNNTAKHMFSGKIVGVERRLFKGHVYGECLIQDANDESKYLNVPFKNENIHAERRDSPTSKGEIIASCPDLISVIDQDTGEALGTAEYRYGLLVFVLAMSPSNKWTDCAKGIAIGGPAAFGYDYEYKPIGTYSKTVSVIEEYGEGQNV
ncbi:unnamed protein product [Kuraishia capsulata CBS 1993]|uniref:Hydantoinase/oxoprolinase N-terminal domain-containing protein n=1 Tax=Kuraishia capsulata CBS 1993 TaxID=1382522 RepID=W6MVD6_9ASCO|nr:uncharacterized protein KUCA_T00002201001 [Kuraishia capsulata CBS 1993]CDK26230.1 unnamed protein product [Kuraishia capsulata CBS 1993]